MQSLKIEDFRRRRGSWFNCFLKLYFPQYLYLKLCRSCFVQEGFFCYEPLMLHLRICDIIWTLSYCVVLCLLCLWPHLAGYEECVGVMTPSDWVQGVCWRYDPILQCSRNVFALWPYLDGYEECVGVMTLFCCFKKLFIHFRVWNFLQLKIQVTHRRGCVIFQKLGEWQLCIFTVKMGLKSGFVQ